MLKSTTKRDKVEPDWRATAAAINALPIPIRRYLQLIEQKLDPEGTVREKLILQQQVDELTFKCAQLESQVETLKARHANG